MIRINLLPDAVRPQQQKGGQGWLIALLAALALEVVAAFVLYSFKQDELNAQRDENKRTEERIKESRGAVKDREQVLEKLEVLRSREQAIEQLERARLGPAAMMVELSHLLTKNRGPSITPEKLAEIREKNPLSSYDQSWDPRRLWLVEFAEEDHVVRLVGMARDGEDVSELARRMNLSSYFSDVRLLPAKREKDSATGVEWVRFQLEARVRY